jgi:hypothetical protein
LKLKQDLPAVAEHARSTLREKSYCKEKAQKESQHINVLDNLIHVEKHVIFLGKRRMNTQDCTLKDGTLN